MQDEKKIFCCGIGNDNLRIRIQTFLKRPDLDRLLSSTDEYKLLKEGVDKYERTFYRHFLFAASFTEYCNHQTPSLRRRIIVYLSFILYVLVTIRHWLTVIFRRTEHWVAIGDSLYLTRDRVAYNFCIACCLATGMLGRWYFYKAENGRKLHFLYTMQTIRNGNERSLESVALKRYARKFQSFTKIFLFWGPLSCCFPTGMAFTTYSLMAWFYRELPFLGISLILSTTGFYYGAYCASFSLIVGITFIELSLTYCCLCYRQCQTRIRKSLHKYHKLPTNVFNDYVKLAVEVYRMNETFSLFIGGMYCFFTPTIDSLIFMTFVSRAHYWVRIPVGLVLAICTFLLFEANYLPAKLNSTVSFYLFLCLLFVYYFIL